MLELLVVFLGHASLGSVYLDKTGFYQLKIVWKTTVPDFERGAGKERERDPTVHSRDHSKCFDCICLNFFLLDMTY